MMPASADTADDVVHRAIAAVPAWADATITARDISAPVMSPMHRGVDSICYALDVNGETLFLKVTHPEASSDIDVASSFVAAQAAARAGVAPLPHHCMPEAQAIVFERLGEGWRTARLDDLAKPDVMAAVVTAKKAMHTTTRLPREWSIFDKLRPLASDTRAVAPFDAAAVGQAMADAARIEVALAAAGTDSRPCHNDGLASNIMLGPNGAVRLVDFDQAANTDPHYELGSLLNEAFVFDSEMMPALEIFEGVARQQTLDRCRLYGIVDDLYWALWAGRMASVSRRTGIEFLKYAQWRFLRCRMALNEPVFERRLGAI